MDGDSIVSLNEVAIEAEEGNSNRELNAFVLEEEKALQHYTKKNWTQYFFLNFINLFHENLSHCQAAQ